MDLETMIQEKAPVIDVLNMRDEMWRNRQISSDEMVDVNRFIDDTYGVGAATPVNRDQIESIETDMWKQIIEFADNVRLDNRRAIAALFDNMELSVEREEITQEQRDYAMNIIFDRLNTKTSE